VNETVAAIHVANLRASITWHKRGRYEFDSVRSSTRY
jgi:hypothetical protein